MFKNLDRSRRVSRILDQVSNSTAQRRGVPVLVGITLVVASLILQSIGVYADSRAVDLLGVICLHLGVLTALMGILLFAPLGK
jgi:hypothetical protein